VPLDTKTPANFPDRAPVVHSEPVPSQKAFSNQSVCTGTETDVAYLPLCGHVAVTGGNTKQVTVKVGEILDRHNRIVGLGGCFHHSQNLRRKCLWNSASYGVRLVSQTNR